MTFLLTLLFLSQLAQAAPALDPANLPAVKDSKSPGAAPKSLDSYVVENRLIYESFSGTGRSSPVMSNETDQKVKLTKLPEKDGAARTELLYQKFTSLSRVSLPGALKPFENKQDLGAYLFDKPLILRRSGKDSGTIENIADVRARVEKSVRDPIARQGLKAALSDEALKGVTENATAGHGCLTDIAGKAVGARWELSREVAGAKFEFRCEFLGWGEAGGRKMELVKFTMPKAKNTRSQPNGAAGVVETSGSGTVAADPASGEVAVNQTNDVSAEPSAKEIADRKAKGQEIPSGNGTVRSTVHFYAP
jgi:hypothetical protein